MEKINQGLIQGTINGDLVKTIIFDGDKYAAITSGELNLDGDKFNSIGLLIKHSQEKFSVGTTNGIELEKEGKLSPVFCMVFKHKESAIVVREWLNRVIEKFEKCEKFKEENEK